MSGKNKVCVPLYRPMHSKVNIDALNINTDPYPFNVVGGRMQWKRLVLDEL